MDLQLDARTALVSASTGGIGHAIAVSLAREGARVIINGRSQASVDAAISSAAEQVPDADLRGVAADLGTAAGIDDVIAAAPEVDILVNNLGIFHPVDVLDSTDEQWRHIFEVNLISGVRLSRHYLRGMLDRNDGRIIFIASEAAITPSLEMPHYSTSKTAQLGLSRVLAERTAGSRVTVNTVMPGSTRTEGVAKLVSDLYPDLTPEQAEARFMAENRSTSLIQRLIDPAEIGDLVAFVASPRGGAINGSALRADGGIARLVF